MNPWFGKAVMLAAMVAFFIIRAPHGQRSRKLKVVKNLRDGLENVLLFLAFAGFFIPLLWIGTSLLDFAGYPLGPLPLAAGTALFVVGLWLFYRSHADLGANWSATLEIREEHSLVTGGVYARVRHPMYSAFILYCLGQMLVVPNWI